MHVGRGMLDSQLTVLNSCILWESIYVNVLVPGRQLWLGHLDWENYLLMNRGRRGWGAEEEASNTRGTGRHQDQKEAGEAAADHPGQSNPQQKEVRHCHQWLGNLWWVSQPQIASTMNVLCVIPWERSGVKSGMRMMRYFKVPDLKFCLN